MFHFCLSYYFKWVYGDTYASFLVERACRKDIDRQPEGKLHIYCFYMHDTQHRSTIHQQSTSQTAARQVNHIYVFSKFKQAHKYNVYRLNTMATMYDRSIHHQQRQRQTQQIALVAATLRQFSRGEEDDISSNVVSTAADVSRATTTTNNNSSSSHRNVEESTTAHEETFLSNQGIRMIPCLARRMSEDHNATVSKARSRSHFLLDTTL